MDVTLNVTLENRPTTRDDVTRKGDVSARRAEALGRVHVCGLYRPALAEPIQRHDEGPVLDGRGLRAGLAERLDYAASLASSCPVGPVAFRVRRRAALAAWVSMTSCSTSEVA